MQSYLRFWGKAGPADQGTAAPTWHPLAYHSLDVAAVAQVFLRHDARLVRALAESSGMEPTELQRFIPWLLAVHDLGKFAAGFQGLRRDIQSRLGCASQAVTYGVRHDALGLQLLMREYASGETEAWRTFVNSPDFETFEDVGDCLKPWFTAVAGHHGKPVPDEVGQITFTKQFDEDTRRAVRDYLRALEQDLGLTPRPILTRPLELEESAAKRTSWLLSGLAVLCDWLGSDTTYFPHRPDPCDLRGYFEGSAVPAAERSVAASHLLAAETPGEARFEELFPGFSPSHTQAAVLESSLPEGPSLFILEAPTGSGKTESALHLAQRLMSARRAHGVFFALPTMATANAMAVRVRRAAPRLMSGIEKDDVVLAHGLRDLADPVDPERKDGNYGGMELSVSSAVRRWYGDRLKKALLAPIGVGTIDQALLAALPVRHQSLRLFGLAGKVLIADEVHASDDYVHGLLRKTLEFHAALGGCAILLSATLPARMRQELEQAFARGLGRTTYQPQEAQAYPLLTHVARGSQGAKPLPFDPSSGRKIRLLYGSDLDEVLAALSSVAEQGGCAAWVRNTVHDCVEGARRLRGILPGVHVFHARFALGHRLERESQVVHFFGPGSGAEDRRGKVLVATQVVEQSLDLDFDHVVTDLAPVDLLFQRAGRLCRHRRDRCGRRVTNGDRRGPPEFRVLGPPPTETPSEDWYSGFYPKAAHVYDHPGQLWRTARLVWSHPEVALPDRCREWIEAVFGEGATPPLPEALERATLRAEGAAKGDAWMALHVNSLRLEQGYVYDLVRWSDDQNTPTRLGEETVRLRLARRIPGGLVPLLGAGTRGWQLSEVRVRRGRVAAEDPGLDVQLLESARATMPDEGQGTVTCELRESEQGCWSGSVADAGGGVQELTYTTELGLLYSDESEDRS